MTVMFVCTGNIYRSRYAEAYLNHRARESGLPIRAVSRGLRVDLVAEDISDLALAAMRRKGIQRSCTSPSRRALKKRDLANADLIIALRESEHRPLMAAAFPGWADRIRYWHVADRDEWPAERTTVEIETGIEALLEELSRSHPAGTR